MKDSPDGTLIAAFSIPGRPATKKNSMRIFRGRLLPSKAYLTYEEHAQPYVKAAAEIGSPITYGVSVEMKVWLPHWKWLPDHVGLLASISDILQKWDVVENDVWVVFHENGHWMQSIDKDNPRVELTIRRLRHPKESR